MLTHASEGGNAEKHSLYFKPTQSILVEEGVAFDLLMEENVSGKNHRNRMIQTEYLF
jgi:hypothetical protein